MNTAGKVLAIDNRQDDDTVGGINLNTLVNAVVIAMRMNDDFSIPQRQPSINSIASAIVKALDNNTTTRNRSLPITSTMESVNTSNISLHLSPISHKPSTMDGMQHYTNNRSMTSSEQSQNAPNLSSVCGSSVNNNIDVMNATTLKSKPVIEWSLTSKNKELLIISGHTFKCNKTTATKRYWRCDEVQHCKIWVKTTLDGTYIDMNNQEHDHFADPDRIVIMKLICNIRTRCKEELGSLATIYEQEMKKSKLSEAQLSRMPRYDQIQSSLSRLRSSLLPPLPSDLNFIIPDKFAVNLDGEQFILGDISNQKRFKRLLIFASERQLDVLFQSEWLFLDGTFKAAPAMFTQLVCIIATFEGSAITTCYALVDGKHCDSYRTIIRTLKNEAEKRGKRINAEFIMSDFEGGLIKAIKAEFPIGVRHVGCYFHHCKSIYRSITTLGLKVPYEKNDIIRETCRKLMAIALMPTEDIEDAYAELLKSITSTTFTDASIFQSMKKLMKYYNREWLITIGKQMFGVNNLNWRTNNLCEGMNNRTNSKLVATHPNIWKILEFLVSEEYHSFQLINQIKTGRKRPQRETREQKRYQKQLNNLNNLYENEIIDLPEMLKGLASMVAHNTKAKNTKS